MTVDDVWYVVGDLLLDSHRNSLQYSEEYIPVARMGRVFVVRCDRGIDWGQFRVVSQSALKNACKLRGSRRSVNED